jgi:predicted O-methyltransferase YrrM
MKLTWPKVDELVSLASLPLEASLEDLQGQHLGSERRNYYRFLYWLVMELRPILSVEIGVELGLGSAHMCAAARTYGGYVAGVDVNWHDLPGKQLQERYDNYYFVHGNSTADETLKRVKQLTDFHGQIGLVFQDSSHHFWASQAEWQAYTHYMDQKNGIWVCDDITPAFHDPNVDPPGKGMVQYWDWLPAREKKLYPDFLHFGNTVGVALL